ncbi:twin-arginine translocase TatA/TatE family subunit [Paenibacillus tepidiphilus]|uniref:twin-arginine translocase TatA/TatE family subunit n=1 Tax=Paenibacillus tepidiphilus TaxID=2608683 RepID=UPI00193C889B
MLNGIGAPGIILLVILALLLFGPNKLPELGRAVGRTFREFKDGTRDMINEPEPTKAAPANPAVPHASAELPQDKRQPE